VFETGQAFEHQRAIRGRCFPSPTLLLLDEHEDDLLRETIKVAGAARDLSEQPTPNPAVCGWLFARGVPGDLPRHLIAAAQQRNASFTPVLLRFADPRVLVRLNEVLQPQERRQLLGPVDHWLALDRFGCLADLQTQPAAPYEHSALALTDIQWARIERVEAFNRTLAMFQDLEKRALEREREPIIDAALERAVHQGFFELDDQIAYALYALLVHPFFDRNALVSRAISDRSEPTKKLADILEALPASVWADMPQFTDEVESA
jgi:hypothetical protein